MKTVSGYVLETAETATKKHNEYLRELELPII